MYLHVSVFTHVCEHAHRQKQKTRQKKKERRVRGSNNKNTYKLFSNLWFIPDQLLSLLSFPFLTQMHHNHVVYCSGKYTGSIASIQKYRIFLNQFLRTCVSYQLHFQRSYFPYLLRKAFCCPVTKLPACPECPSAQGELIVASLTHQPSFLRPSINAPQDFYFIWDSGPEIPLQVEKIKKSNHQIQSQKASAFYPHRTLRTHSEKAKR